MPDKMGNANSKSKRHESASSTTPLNSGQPLSPTARRGSIQPSSASVDRTTPTTSVPLAGSTGVSSPSLPTFSCNIDDCEITTPAPPPRLRKLSELIDPTLLFSEDAVVRSPSGNVLGRRSFSEREDRPLSLRERQERIRQGLSGQQISAAQGPATEAYDNIATNRQGVASTKQSAGAGNGCAQERRRSCCLCF